MTRQQKLDELAPYYVGKWRIPEIQNMHHCMNLVSQNVYIILTGNLLFMTIIGPAEYHDMASETITKSSPCFTCCTKRSLSYSWDDILDTYAKMEVGNIVKVDCSYERSIFHWIPLQSLWIFQITLHFLRIMSFIKGSVIAGRSWRACLLSSLLTVFVLKEFPIRDLG